MLYDSASLRHFVGVDSGRLPVPGSTTITKFCKLLNHNKLEEALLARAGRELQVLGFKVYIDSIVDATIIGAPSATKNAALNVSADAIKC